MALRIICSFLLSLTLFSSALFADTITINVDDSIPAIMAANTQPGTVFLVKAGIHRGARGLNLKPDQHVTGELGANGEKLSILSGTKLLSNWLKEGDYWVHDISDIEIIKYGHMYKGFSNICNDLYFDNLFLRHVVSKDDLDTLEWNTDVWPIGKYEQLAEINEMKEKGELTNCKWWCDTINKKAYMKDDPTGHTMEISYISSIGFGVNAYGASARNLIGEKYCSRWQGGIMGFRTTGDNDTTKDCDTIRGALMENCEARWGHANGMGFHGCGQNFIMRNCYAHHNGQMGVKLVKTKDVIIEGCEIAYNCFERTIGYIPSENGGTKFAGSNSGTIIRNNYVHHNWDNGLWFDGGNKNAIIEGNICEKNTGAGIFIEISDPENDYFNVRHNVSRRNGYCGWFYAAQVQISVTHSAEIHHNVLEVDWVQGGHSFAILYQIDDAGRRLKPPHHTLFHHNDVTWNKPNICPGQDIVPWQPTVAGNTKHGWGVSVWGGSVGGTKVDVPDSIRQKRLTAYEAQKTCFDTCGNRLDTNWYHCEGGAEETEQYKYWRWPAQYPDTNDYDNDGTIDYDYDMIAYSLKGIQDSLGQEKGSTVDNVIDTNIAGQLQKILNMGAPDSIVEGMGQHFGLTVPEIKAYIPVRPGAQPALFAPSPNSLRALIAGGLLKLRFSVKGVYKVALYDARGRQVFKQVYRVDGGKTLKPVISIKELPAGIYTLKTATQGSHVVQKVAHCL